MTISNQNAKRFLGAFAAARVSNGMRLGIGSGSTVAAFIDALGERIREFGLEVVCVAASVESERHARAQGLKVESLDTIPEVDLAVDGADAVSPDRVLIKGGGAALVRERLVIASAGSTLILVGDDKPTGPFYHVTVPIAVVPFGWAYVRDCVRRLTDHVELRRQESLPVVTDDGLYLLDAHFDEVRDPIGLHQALKLTEGVVDTGIFAGYQPEVWISDGVAVWPLRRAG